MEENERETKNTENSPNSRTTKSLKARSVSHVKTKADKKNQTYTSITGESVKFDNNSKKKREKKKKGYVGKLIVLLVIIVAVSLTLSGIIISLGRDMLGANDTGETVVVSVPEGSSATQIAYLLKDNGVIESPKFFLLFNKLSHTGSDFKPGEHEFRTNMAYETVVNILQSDPISDENSVTVTFTEGITLPEAAGMLEQQGVCNADDFIEQFNSYDDTTAYEFSKHRATFKNNERFYKMEGFLFPDTYTFYKDMDIELVCDKILENFDSKITSDMYDKMDKDKVSLDEIITLASMIQAEAGSKDQMGKISSVFWNRLNDSAEYPKLQSDPTKDYVEDTIKPNIGSYDQTMFDAYDTYTCTGLPAGPIGNPGLDAIKAALDPDDTKYYYFYSDLKTKETYFAETYEEHQANIAKVNEKYGIITTTEGDEIVDSEIDETTEEN